jgi:hypothetical protein
MWFVRDLFIVALVAPLMWPVARRAPKVGLLVALILWIVNKNVKVGNLITFDSFGFFFFGMVAGAQQWPLSRLDRWGAWLIGGYVGFALVDAWFMTAGSPTEGLARSPTHPLHLLLLLLGMVAAWDLAGRWARRPMVYRWLTWLAPFAFFVFATHEPLLGGLKKLLYKALLPEASPEVIAVYLLAPALAVGITLAVGWMVRRFAPRVYAFVTGGRAA